MRLFDIEKPISIKHSIVELRQTHDGIYYIMLNGHELQNTFTLDIQLATKLYERCLKAIEGDNLIPDTIIKSNVAKN